MLASNISLHEFLSLVSISRLVHQQACTRRGTPPYLAKSGQKEGGPSRVLVATYGRTPRRKAGSSLSIGLLHLQPLKCWAKLSQVKIRSPWRQENHMQLVVAHRGCQLNRGETTKAGGCPATSGTPEHFSVLSVPGWFSCLFQT